MARVCVGEHLDKGKAPNVVELPLGLSWTVGKAAGWPQPWQELARRADVALTEGGWTRTVDWSFHIWPKAIVQARVSRSG